MKQRGSQGKATAPWTAATSKFGGFGTVEGSGSLSYLTEPPSFTSISDPNVVVSLKNVLKKDAITKTKALEELLAYAQAHPHDQGGGVEDAVLEVWVEIYPRTSIDNSRRVRELSHSLQFELIKSARKRMERHVPKIVGAWLAGVYDRDRAAARAASEGLSSFLTTPEKVLAFWKKCQPQILDYAIDAIKETEDTLSDERSTTKEDAEAKYLRVITSSLSLILTLLQKLDVSDMEKQQEKFDEYFAEETVWKSITFNDSAVRKSICNLLITCIDRKLPYANSTQARQAMVTGGLRTAQTGSALEYVSALTKLSQVNPAIWIASAKEKKPALSRLQQFIAKGSQGSPAKFWEHLDQLIAILPRDQLQNLQIATELLNSVKLGVTNREEPRTNTSMSWKCYIDTAKRLLKILSDDDKQTFTKEQLFPLFEQFLFSVSDKSTSIPVGPNALAVFVEAHLAILEAPSLVSSLEGEWARLSEQFCAKISSSLPEVSRDYQSSQEKIGEEGRRWFGLVGEIHTKFIELQGALPDQTTKPSITIIEHCINNLESRNMKPFGAARILEYALSTTKHLFSQEIGSRFSAFLMKAAQESMEKVLQSAASRPLLSCLRIMSVIPSQEDGYGNIWRAWIDAILKYSDAASRSKALASLLSQEKGSKLGQDNERLQDTIISQTLETVEVENNDWDLLIAAVTYEGLTNESCQKLAQTLVDKLDKDAPKLESALRALEIIAKGRPRLFAQDEALQTALVAKLLGLSEISDGGVSSKALAVRSLLDVKDSGRLPVIGIIHSNLERPGPQSLEIVTLVSQAQQAHHVDGVSLEDIFPSTNAWMQKLSPFLEQPINPSLSITNKLGGAAMLSSQNARRLDLRAIPRDRKGRSAALRMAIYAGLVLEGNLEMSKLPRQFQIELLFIQCLTLQLVTDQLTSLDQDGLWIALEDTEATSEAESLVTSLRNWISKNCLATNWWDQTLEDEPSQVLRGLIDLLKEESKVPTPRGVYSARAISEIFQTIAEAQGFLPGVEETFLKPALSKITEETVLLSAALISGLGETLQSSKLANTFCNRLISDVAGASLKAEKTMMTLALISLSAGIYESGDLPVANNRIVFAVRQITSWLDDDEVIDPTTNAEICRVLDLLLPCMNEVFGSYWDRVIEYCIELWEKAAEHPLPECLPYVHASLRLMKTLENMPDPNDDLQDALRDSVSKKSKSLIELLKLPRGKTSQPLRIVDSFLCREIEKVSINHIPDIGDIFELVASESEDIQTAAFSLLHRAIPAEQEQRSVDALLDKTDSALPDELLSLLMDAPTMERYSDEMLAQFPSPIRSYLLSWKLVFDAYSTSSFKIRNDFTENLKANDCIIPFYDFVFDVLGHSAALPLNLDKQQLTSEHIKDYDIKLADAESDEHSMQWLLVHLFYLTLKYIPGAFKLWYINCRSKQTKKAVETWTAKYFSPLITVETLEEVQTWADQQEPPAHDEQELIIKVSKTSKEVIAAYEVDELQASIAIKLPANYPIEAVTVQSQNRVAVNERKWQSWIMITQSVITFSGGNIIDGLQVFKRNIVGALKGQTECAICYSIISTDKRMPDKRCTTCKNLFHRTCLYKWFQTSSQNTCPLCRNPIDYLGTNTAKRRQA